MSNLKKVLYGMLQAALLFWKDLSENLEKWGFTANPPYDWCVANKMVDRKQCMIIWHVDNLKVLHVDPAVVESILDLLNKHYGKETLLVVTRGKIHEYLGMTLNFSKVERSRSTYRTVSRTCWRIYPRTWAVSQRDSRCQPYVYS
jgi:hypothetical protein